MNSRRLRHFLVAAISATVAIVSISWLAGSGSTPVEDGTPVVARSAVELAARGALPPGIAPVPFGERCPGSVDLGVEDLATKAPKDLNLTAPVVLPAGTIARVESAWRCGSPGTPTVKLSNGMVLSSEAGFYGVKDAARELEALADAWGGGVRRLGDTPVWLQMADGEQSLSMVRFFYNEVMFSVGTDLMASDELMSAAKSMIARMPAEFGPVATASEDSSAPNK